MERVVMRPPGHSGKAKKGHLCFDAIYETGEDNVEEETLSITQQRQSWTSGLHQ